MAAASLSEPGTEFGPCASECGHSDCAMTRKMAQTKCLVCGYPIGYGRRFYREDIGSTLFVGISLSHARCVETAIEKNKKESAA